MPPTDNPGLFDCRPILRVENVARSIDYYVNVLGGGLGWAWDDAKQAFLRCGEEGTPTFALVGLGEVQLMLAQQSQGQPGTWLHLDVHSAEQLDAIHQSWKSRSARITEPPVIRPWGTYEMRVEDLDGHVLRVSSPPRQHP